MEEEIFGLKFEQSSVFAKGKGEVVTYLVSEKEYSPEQDNMLAHPDSLLLTKRSSISNSNAYAILLSQATLRYKDSSEKDN